MDTFYEMISQDKGKKWKKKLKFQKMGKENSIKRGYSKQNIKERWHQILKKNKKLKDHLKKNPQNKNDPFYKGVKKELLSKETFYRSELFSNSCENFIGLIKVPLGIAGPLKVSGMHSSGEYFIPMATTEGALVASYNRGMSAMNLSGGARSIVIEEGVSRDPGILFRDLIEVGEFLIWARKNEKKFKAVAEKTTRFGKLKKIEYTLDGNTVFMKCNYYTADAMGQNMVTIATQEVVEFIRKKCPIKPKFIILEGGMSGDKKASIHHAIKARGKKVIAECIIKKSVLKTVLHVSPREVVWGTEVIARGYHNLGSIAYNAHYANGLAAMFMALGQDPACVSECHIGHSRVELTKKGDLYVSATIPSILCGTVGGGCKLPTPRACLEMMGLYGPGKANELAEVIGAVLIAGELSLGAAMYNGNFAKAHQILARDTHTLKIDLKGDGLDQSFIKSQAFLVKLSKFPDRKIILRLYALYKQATIGDCNIDAPGFFASMKQKKKYEAWKNAKGISNDEAKKRYINLVMELVEKDNKIRKDATKEFKMKEGKEIENETGDFDMGDLESDDDDVDLKENEDDKKSKVSKPDIIVKKETKKEEVVKVEEKKIKVKEEEKKKKKTISEKKKDQESDDDSGDTDDETEEEEDQKW